MEYVIKLGKNYIGCVSGKYTEVQDVNLAVKGPMHKLNNLMQNCVAPDKRKKCKIVSESTIKLPTVDNTAVQHVASVDNQDDKPLFDEVIAKLKSLNITGFNTEHSELSKRLSKIDQEITDIQHYIELTNLNVVQGYKAYKLLHEKLIKRRAIKDDMWKFQLLSNVKVSDIFDGTFDKSLAEFNNKTYNPRVLKELFTEGEN